LHKRGSVIWNHLVGCFRPSDHHSSVNVTMPCMSFFVDRSVSSARMIEGLPRAHDEQCPQMSIANWGAQVHPAAHGRKGHQDRAHPANPRRHGSSR
jgi:hypothetical protein